MNQSELEQEKEVKKREKKIQLLFPKKESQDVKETKEKKNTNKPQEQ
jgi:hypothetical protein